MGLPQSKIPFEPILQTSEFPTKRLKVKFVFQLLQLLTYVLFISGPPLSKVENCSGTEKVFPVCREDQLNHSGKKPEQSYPGGQGL